MRPMGNVKCVIRSHYTMDSEKKSDEGTVYLSVDMQKVVMLPRISGVKTIVFTKRLIVFHEIFVQFVAKSCGKPFGAI